MKVGILTFHFARNYGAALQCYALQEALRAAGHEPSVVDYRPASVASGYRWLDVRRFWGRTPGKFLRKTARELQVVGKRRRRYAAFEDFARTRLALSEGKGADVLLCGSDQVWNARLTAGFDPRYWGQEGGRHLSYAASFGDYVPTSEARDILKSGFEVVSVREKSAAAMLEGLDVRADVDPVFLLSREAWSALADDARPVIDSPYLLLYQVKPSLEARSAAERIAAQRGLRLVVLSAKVEQDNSREVAASSPADFVRLFRDASAVVTTSFHGTAFSVIFHKDFLSFKAVGASDTRQQDLLDSLGLTHCLAGTSACDLQSPDWLQVDARLSELAAPSQLYISRLR